MKKKNLPQESFSPWWSHTTWRQRSNLWGMTAVGLVAICVSIWAFWERDPLPALGMLLLGCGLTAAGGSFLLGLYRKLTDRGAFLAFLVNRAGLLLLGPAVTLVLQPWRKVAPGVMTRAQCAGFCAALCALSILPCGVSLVWNILSRRRDRV